MVCGFLVILCFYDWYFLQVLGTKYAFYIKDGSSVLMIYLFQLIVNIKTIAGVYNSWVTACHSNKILYWGT